MAKTNNERQAELKARRIKLGLVRRPYWATPSEHEELKLKLKQLRETK